ncbi:MAG: bile acid:sodium symporter [Chitinivibrionales bacterium]|nr:bile acid:sodium symporter [Chitinivibrionales bacterium]
MGQWIARNWFVEGLLIAVVIGYLFPQWGTILNPHAILSTAIVVVIFFNLGMIIPTHTFHQSFKQIRLHVFIQLFIFVVIPLYFVVTTHIVRSFVSPELIIGILALSCLPTTVSSCVVFTQQSGGNAIGATFSSSLANAAGVILTPLILSALLHKSGQAFAAHEVMNTLQNILFQMIVPMVAGFGLQLAILGQRVKKLRPKVNLLNSFFIILIVFLAFAKAAKNPLFRDVLFTLALPLVYLGVSHCVLLLLAYIGSRMIGLDRQNTVAALYVAPQKTIAMGVPLLSAYFSTDEKVLGMAIIPLLFYHPWQLFVAALISRLPWMHREAGG